MAYDFPDSPFDGQLYPISPAAGQAQYQYVAARGHWVTLGVTALPPVGPFVTQTNNGTGSAEMPNGNTAQRDVTPSVGYTRFNTNANSLEYYDGSNWVSIREPINAATINGGRLTPVSGTPVAFGSYTAITTLYYTPYKNDRISLFNGSNWETISFSEVTISLAGLAANTNFDIFGFNNSGVLDYEIEIWSNSGAGTSARAEAVSFLNGVRVKSSDNTRKLLGTFRTTGIVGQTEFSVLGGGDSGFPLKLFIANEHNKEDNNATMIDSTAHIYTGAATRFFDNDANNQIQLVTNIGGERNFQQLHTRNYDAGGIFTRLDGSLPIAQTTIRDGGTYPSAARSLTYSFSYAEGYHEWDLLEAGDGANGNFGQTLYLLRFSF